MSRIFVIVDSLTGQTVDDSSVYSEALRVQDFHQHRRNEDGTFHPHHIDFIDTEHVLEGYDEPCAVKMPNPHAYTAAGVASLFGAWLIAGPVAVAVSIGLLFSVWFGTYMRGAL